MNPKVPKYVWNVVALFFTGWLITASWLLLGGDDSPIVRLAFGGCGVLGIIAGSAGGMFKQAKHYIGRVNLRNLGCWSAVLLVLFIVAAILAPGLLHTRRVTHATSIASDLKNEGIQLLIYADEHEGTLPPDTGRKGIYRFITPVADQKTPFYRPFVWCGELSGLRLDEIANPERVVVAYATKPDERCRPVLYLDGHVRNARSQVELRELLLERTIRIAHAKQAKAERKRKTLRLISPRL